MWHSLGVFRYHTYETRLRKMSRKKSACAIWWASTSSFLHSFRGSFKQAVTTKKPLISKMRSSIQCLSPTCTLFFHFACSGASCLSADKNPDIKPDVEDECVPQPLSPYQSPAAQTRTPSLENTSGRYLCCRRRRRHPPPIPVPSPLAGRNELKMFVLWITGKSDWLRWKERSGFFIF